MPIPSEHSQPDPSPAEAGTAKLCGGCQACCWLFPLLHLDKDRMAPCPHQCEAGCAIHDRARHVVCETFECAWLLEPNWGDELRPDRSKIIWQCRGSVADRLGRPHPLLQGNMVSRDAHLSRVNREFMERQVRACRVVRVEYQPPDGTEGISASYFDRLVFPQLSDETLTACIREEIRRGEQQVQSALGEVRWCSSRLQKILGRGSSPAG